MQNDEWLIDSTGPLSIGQVYHSCAVCGDYLYSFGGDIGSDLQNNSESYTGIIQKCEMNNSESTGCVILDAAYNNVRYSRATSINDDIIVLAGGQYNVNEYSSNVDIFDCRNDQMIAAQSLPIALTDFQMDTLFNDSFVCLFGGQTVQNGMFKISAEILCAPVIQDGVARSTFAVSLTEGPKTTQFEDGVASTTSLQPTQTKTDRPTVRPTLGPTTTLSPSINENVESVNGNNMLDEFENESNSNAAVIYGLTFGFVGFAVICIIAVVLYKKKCGNGKDEMYQAQPVGNGRGFDVERNVNDESDNDELGFGRHHGDDAIIESRISDSYESE